MPKLPRRTATIGPDRWQAPAAGQERRTPAVDRRASGRGRWIAALVGLLLVAGLVPIGVREWDHPQLRDASADYRRGLV